MISLLSKLLFAGVAAALVAIPPLKSRVTDLTGTLNAQQRGALEQTLAGFEARKGAQIAVLIVPSTQPETVEQYAVRVEEAWKLGRKGVDDSVLFLIAIQDRTVRLEVGYGLEGVLPDAAAKRIIEDDITPRFRQGDLYGGIRAGVDRMMRTIEGEPLPPPRQAARPAGDQFMQWLVPALFVAVVLGGILRMLLGRVLGSTVVGGLAGAAVWALTGLLAFGVGAGVLVFLFSLFGAMSGAGRGWGGGGWSSGGGWSGGGGFGGGGGSSGGGGASGRW